MLPTTTQTTDLAAFTQAANNILSRIGTDNSSQFMKMQKNGEWTFGADQEFVDPKSRWAVNPGSMAVGYACWGDSELLDERMALITDDPVDFNMLPDQAFPWTEQISMQLACTTDHHKDVQVIYSATSKGGRDAFSKLLKEIVARMQSNPDEIVPIVHLANDSYRHKKYGMIYTPVLEIVSWTSFNAQPEPEAAPKPEPEPAPEPAPTTRRRRRRTA